MTQDEIRDAYAKFKGHKYNCRNKKDRNGDKVEMRLTFDEWLKIWLDSGHWHERGRAGYVMARNGDVGHYEVGNVRIITSAENISMANTGRIVGETQREASRANGRRNKGKAKSEETRRKMSLAHQGKLLDPEHREKVVQALKANHWTKRHDAAEIKARIATGVKKRGVGNKKSTGRAGVSTKGLRWWTDGQTAVCRAECPPGFAPGRKVKQV
jgi:hypothetical protein